MKPIDRFGLDLHLMRHLRDSDFSRELFYLEATRKVRTDNTFSFQNIRYEAPRDLRGQTIVLRYSRFTDSSLPVVYQDNQRLGSATPLDAVANDRRPDISF
jgi:hypothetical protein